MRLATNVRSFDLKVHAGGPQFRDFLEIDGRAYLRRGGKGERSQPDFFHLVAEEHSADDSSAGGTIKEYLWRALA